MAAVAIPLALPITHRRRRIPNNPHNLSSVNQKLVPNTTNITAQGPRPINIFQFQSHPPDSYANADSIESCSSIDVGRQIHAHAIKSGFGGSREFMETKILVMYGRCGGAEDARQLFEKMPQRNVYSWAGIISTYVGHGYFEDAFSLFERLCFEGMVVEFFVFPVLLKACGSLHALELGRQLHGFVMKGDFLSNLYVGNALIDMYGKCECLDGAAAVFKQMPERDCVSWNSMITAYEVNGMVIGALELLTDMRLSGNPKPNLISWSAVIGGFSQNEYDEEAIAVLLQMLESGIEPNAQILASILPASARLRLLDVGKEIHGYIMRHGFVSNAFIINGLLNVYRRCNDMVSALKLFLIFSLRNLFSFNTMIVGYCEIGDMEMAKQLFDQMDLHNVKRDTISWNLMISGYVDNRQFDKALEFFRLMQVDEGVSSNSFSLGSALTACADMAALRQGKELHSFAIVRSIYSDTFVGGALVDMYCKCQDLASAHLVFENVTEKDATTWNALISGYARCNQMKNVHELLYGMNKQGVNPNINTWNGMLAGSLENGSNELAVELFSGMQITGMKPDNYSLSIVLSACARLLSIEWGKQAHAYSVRHSQHLDAHIGTALVDMYAKCGSITKAELVFHRISQQNLVAYNTMLAGFAMHGLSKEANSLFHKLLFDGLEPDAVTFLSILSSCNHQGSVEEGFKYFNLMSEFNIKAELKHYTCVIDLLSRAGCLNDAYKLIQKMPMDPDAVVWGSLLSGCVIHENVELGGLVADRLIELDEGNAGNYIMIANLCAAAGRHEVFAKVRQIIKNDGMHKIPGRSWIEDQNQVHVFVAGDRSHGQAGEIYATMENLNSNLRDTEMIR